MKYDALIVTGLFDFRNYILYLQLWFKDFLKKMEEDKVNMTLSLVPIDFKNTISLLISLINSLNL